MQASLLERISRVLIRGREIDPILTSRQTHARDTDEAVGEIHLSGELVEVLTVRGEVRHGQISAAARVADGPADFRVCIYHPAEILGILIRECQDIREVGIRDGCVQRERRGWRSAPVLQTDGRVEAGLQLAANERAVLNAGAGRRCVQVGCQTVERALLRFEIRDGCMPRQTRRVKLACDGAGKRQRAALLQRDGHFGERIEVVEVVRNQLDLELLADRTRKVETRIR